ncbi:MAG: glutathione synthetase [Saprospirales bacterium]|nr:MAG: glutathione synthetase [Saprospirales bacterium]
MDILVLTDHRAHTVQNSVYELVGMLKKLRPQVNFFIGSRGLDVNDDFFFKMKTKEISVRQAAEDFQFSDDHQFYQSPLKVFKIADFDWIILRLPRPIPTGFFDFLRSNFDEKRIINRPSGVEITGSKLFLLNYPHWCPPMRHCKNTVDIQEFAADFPIVLKPLEDYGGRGLVKIDGQKVWEGNTETDLITFLKKLEERNSFEYLAMKYLSNVHLGDKRIMISNDTILGATLRLPPEGNWLCNVSQGGRSASSQPDERETAIAMDLIKDMKKHGVVLFGFDTLTGDDGLRYLSEINTLSLGGLAPADKGSDMPIMKNAALGIWNYIDEKEKKD